MIKDFYIFRHGETDFNKEKRWQGQKYNKELNETGIKQAYNTAKNLEHFGVEVIYTSPLKRAYMTGEIASNYIDVPLVVKENLKEGYFGVAEGLTKDEIARQFNLDCERWYNDDANFWDVGFPEGETKRQIAERGLRALNEIIEQDNCSKIGISAHGSIIRNMLTSLGYIPGPIPNGKIYHLRYEKGEWILM